MTELIRVSDPMTYKGLYHDSGMTHDESATGMAESYSNQMQCSTLSDITKAWTKEKEGTVTL